MTPEQLMAAEENIVLEYRTGLPNVINELGLNNPPLMPLNRPEDSNNFYVASYPSLHKASQILCNQVRSNQILQLHTMLTLATLAFGWMPQRLGQYATDIDGIEAAFGGININDAKEAVVFLQNTFPEPVLVSPTNNSWSGLSKVLHFINPSIFPIWDRKVAMNFHPLKNNQNWTNRLSRYISYISWCHLVFASNNNTDHVTIQQAVSQVQTLFVDYVRYREVEISRVRALEFILFARGKTLNH
ncbi:MAG: hypothetical protein OXF73_00575 [Gammaproteobacteria bacterium]|nr:hypothetical protein [Gammaproteobacteria bacterium]